MSSGLLSIGASGLDAAYTALRTTGNNIANVSTPGYSREVVNVSAQVATGAGSVYIGSGVKVDAISRIYSDFLGQQTNLAQANSSQADTGLTLANQVNGLFSNPATGIGAAIDSFFAQVQGLANNPGSAASRQSLLSSAQQLSGQFNDVAGQLQLMSQSADQQIAQQVATVNTTVSQIAQLNDQISVASATGGSPNNLLDQRDQAIATLNQSIGVTSVAQSDGSVNIFLANGQPLLVGDRATALASGADPVNPQGVVVGTMVGSTISPLDPNASGGGSIGALLKFRANTLPDIQNQLGRIATVLSAQFNALQSLGVDQNGAQGANFFSVPAPSTVTSSNNADAATVSTTAKITDASRLQASDYRVQVLGPGNYTITRLSDNASTSFTGSSVSIDGMTVSFQGLASGASPATGDVFTIEPVRAGAQNISVALSQGSQIAAASPLATSLNLAAGSSLAVQNLALSPLSNATATLTGGPVTGSPMLNKVVVSFTTPPAQYSTVTWSGGVAGAPSTPQSYVAGQAISGNGWQLTLTGNPANGDSVTVQPGGVGGGDNRVALMMSQAQGLANTGLSGSGTGGTSITGAVSGMIAEVGSIAARAQTEQQSRSSILQHAQSAQSSVSGVNLDEEASRLLQYQQQYQAAARLIQTASTVFNSILQAAGGA